mgnify:CR=1 FL=1
MSIPQTITGDFHVDLKALLPRLRIYALSLTRDRDRADWPFDAQGKLAMVTKRLDLRALLAEAGEAVVVPGR